MAAVSTSTSLFGRQAKAIRRASVQQATRPRLSHMRFNCLENTALGRKILVIATELYLRLRGEWLTWVRELLVYYSASSLVFV